MIVAVAMALAVDASYITACASSAQAFKTATLLKTLKVNALITGEIGVGKKSLASYIMPNTQIIDAFDLGELLVALETQDRVIISNLENSPNIKKVIDAATASNARVIATAKTHYANESVDKYFSVKFDIAPLSQRPQDVEQLVELFAKEASMLFSTKKSIKLKDFKPNLSQNSVSLRRQVMMISLLQDISEDELLDIVKNYLVDKLGSNSDYKNFLHLYEVPLIKAGIERFKSQLQLADKLGLNRNTLRKKIADNEKYL